MAKKYTNDDIRRAERVSILQVAQSLGIETHKVGGGEWDYRHVDNDGLVFNTAKNIAYLHQTKETYNTIKFVQMTTGGNFVTAMEQLLTQDYSQIEIDTRVHEKEPFSDYLRDSFDKKQKAIKNYLIEERKIDPRIVNTLIKNGYIKEDGYKQIVFYWQMNGAKVGATIRGTQYDNEKFSATDGYYKGIAKNSERYFGFNVPIGDKVERLYIFEAPIDALSYWTLHPELKNCMLASIDGVKTKSVFKLMNYLTFNHCELENLQIYIGSDNDKYGQAFANELLNFPIVRQVSSEFENDRLFIANFPAPQFKDWNEQLQKTYPAKQIEQVAYYFSQSKQELALVKRFDQERYQVTLKSQTQSPQLLDPTSRQETLELLRQYDFEKISKHDLKRFGFDAHDRHAAQAQVKTLHHGKVDDYELSM